MTAPDRHRTRPTTPIGTVAPSSSTTSSSTFTRRRPTVWEMTSGESPGTVPVVIAASVLV